MSYLLCIYVINNILTLLLLGEIEEFRKERGKKGCVRIEMERMLRKKYRISRPRYHGGDLTGVKVKVLFQNIDKIFEDFKTITLEVNQRAAADDEVTTMLDMCSDLGFLLDGVFAMARTKVGKLNDELVNVMRRMIKCCLQLWRFLRLSMNGPKTHGMEDHLLAHMQRWKGIGDFCEDFVEQSHQTGVRDEIRTAGLDRCKAFKSHSNWEWSSLKGSVKEIKKEVMKKTGRKRKRGSEDNKMQRKSIRDAKRIQSLEKVESGKYDVMQDYKLLQQQRIEHVIAVENNAE